MRRFPGRWAGLFLALFPVLSVPLVAHGQWYSPYGWGGWGGETVGGSVARGMGAFAMGVGSYNRQTAEARAINANTMMAWNEYLWQSRQLRRARYLQELAGDQADRTAALRELELRQLYEPTEADITSGNALNAVLNQLTTPSIPRSIIENNATGMTLAGKDVARIPFKFAQGDVILSLDRLAGDQGWPQSLQKPVFEPLRKKYEEVATRIKETPGNEYVPNETLAEAAEVVAQLRVLAEKSLEGPELAEAIRFLQSQNGMLSMARTPEVKEVLAEVTKFEDVPITNTIAFMNLFNLEFGAAKTPEEEQLYLTTLYPGLRKLRDSVEKELGEPIATRALPPAEGRGERTRFDEIFQPGSSNQAEPTPENHDPAPVNPEPAPEPPQERP